MAEFIQGTKLKEVFTKEAINSAFQNIISLSSVLWKCFTYFIDYLHCNQYILSLR